MRQNSTRHRETNTDSKEFENGQTWKVHVTRAKQARAGTDGGERMRDGIRGAVMRTSIAMPKVRHQKQARVCVTDPQWCQASLRTKAASR